jgi:hypothetical protein
MQEGGGGKNMKENIEGAGAAKRKKRKRRRKLAERGKQGATSK